nr:uncharacterized protein LOC111413082 isoform X1 [Onthophagus taurus]
MDLKIILDKVDSDNPAFIGDITDCTGSVRIIKAISGKSDQVSCKSINHPSISSIKSKIVVTSSFENTLDALWLSKNNCCEGIVSKKELEDLLKCFITTENYDRFIQGEEICFLSFRKKSNSVCEVLINEPRSNYSSFLWFILPIIILLGCIGSFFYFLKQHIQTSHSMSSSWIYMCPMLHHNR